MKSDYSYMYIVIMGKYVDGKLKNPLFYIKSYIPIPYNALFFPIMKEFFPASTNVECDNHMKVGQDEEIPQYQNIN